MKNILSLLLTFLLTFNALAAGKIQNADVKSEAELISAGATKAQLINDSKIYVSAGGINDRLDNAIAAGVVGGQNADNINYISATNSLFEFGTPTWVTFADTAQSTPTDGVGGSPAVTFAAFSSATIQGAKVGRFTKDAANRQGQGASLDFSIEPGDQGKMMKFQFSYATSANYVDADMGVWVYDVTNSRLIDVVDRDINANSFGNFIGTFQASSNSTSYRAIAFVRSTSALAYTVDFDRVLTQPLKSGSKGAAVTDWQAFTPTGTWTTNTTYSGRWRRVGDLAEFQVKVATSGAPNATSLLVNIPFGWVIDTNKFIPTSDTDVIKDSSLTVNDSGATGYSGVVVFSSSTSVRAIASNAASTYTVNNTLTNTVPITFGSGDSVILNFSVPIAGWSSNLVLSEDGGQRLISTDIRRTASQSIPNATDSFIDFVQTIDDTTGSADLAGDRILVPESGYYDLSAWGIFDTNVTGFRLIELWVYDASGVVQFTLPGPRLNGISGSVTTVPVSYSSFKLTKGWYVKVNAYQNSGGSLGVSGRLIISKRSSPQTLAGSETVSARYTSNNGQAIAATASGLEYEDKVWDTHNAYNTTTGRYYCPVSGKYLVKAQYQHDNLNVTNGNTPKIYIYKNTNEYTRGLEVTGTVNNANYLLMVSDLVDCSLGDYILIAAETPSASTMTASGTANSVSIVRVGN